jgi:hypothetical protein
MLSAHGTFATAVEAEIALTTAAREAGNKIAVIQNLTCACRAKNLVTLEADVAFAEGSIPYIL